MTTLMEQDLQKHRLTGSSLEKFDAVEGGRPALPAVNFFQLKILSELEAAGGLRVAELAARLPEFARYQANPAFDMGAQLEYLEHQGYITQKSEALTGQFAELTIGHLGRELLRAIDRNSVSEPLACRAAPAPCAIERTESINAVSTSS